MCHTRCQSCEKNNPNFLASQILICILKLKRSDSINQIDSHDWPSFIFCNLKQFRKETLGMLKMHLALLDINILQIWGLRDLIFYLTT